MEQVTFSRLKRGDIIHKYMKRNEGITRYISLLLRHDGGAA